ncbi:type I DNA topoisomerase [Streptomyces caniscabiei]|uniref:type I DNA topoisomerase n=1 Tax=Streptomyces caniscabiei TaxID=2746961 RepID=UPI0029BC63F4|nr:type I DNA topoisomerase [Streptomyces caniscabiei]MDX2776159.1 type I DNA topoisomerase [Streptomyces caniscabiei]
MSKNLVIVESPAKAKTIEKYLGRDFTVKSSIGHIRGLPSKNGSVDVSNDFKPRFEINADKKKTITELRKEVKAADTVWLASDEDREGEAIAWHLAEVLKLDPKTTKRIVFHEITKSALDEAVKSPRTIDMKLVEAQQARQSLDYLVGFELSPVLWRKVRPQLSAGRVQSVAVRLIVEREAEIEAHQPESTFKLTAEFILSDGTILPATSSKKHSSIDDVREILEAFSKSTFTVADVSKKPGTRNPSAPFTTSTLQQEASSKLGFSPRSTMQLAQRLYEAGLITYMRTDSVNLSTQALGAMTNFIKSEYGENYHQFRTFKSKSANAQEAHEAIRPTNVTLSSAGADAQQQKLYNLIWRRTLASQMTPATLEKTTISIAADKTKEVMEAKGEVVVFDGFLKVYGRSGDDTLLPPVAAGDPLTLKTAEALEQLSRGPARYTEASLVRTLEEKGIGRPSTYASTINTIQARGYVERGDIEGIEKEVAKLSLLDGSVTETKEKIQYGKDSNKLFPTDTGKVVTDFLVKHFTDVMNYDFTKKVETELDEIAVGQKDRVKVLTDFYTPFHKLVEESAGVSRAEATQTRHIGDDPKTGLPIFARFGRFGPMLQKGEQSDDPKPTFAPLPAGAKIETVTLDQALEMFKLPRTVGTTKDGKEIKANIGRFGPYVVIDKLFVSIKPLDPHTITLDQALELYEAKLKTEAEKNIADFGDGIKVLNGRYGPYITDGKKNAKIPKDTDPKSITHDEAKKLLADTPDKKPRRRVVRRKTS